MCLIDLLDFTPDQREAIAKVESLRAMRDATAAWRTHYRSMPAAGVDVLPPCAEASAAGSFKERAP